MFGGYMDYIESTMDLTTVKRNTISDNIANYNTPEYKAKKVDESTMFQDTLNGVLKGTNSKHITTNALMTSQPTIYEDSETSEREDGNNVDLTVEMMDLIETQSQQSKAVQAFNYEIGLIRTAIGK